MNNAISKQVEQLLNQPRGRGMFVSCYADMTVAEAFQRPGFNQLKTLEADACKRLADDPAARQEFEENMQAIHAAFESEAAKGSRGMAVFSSRANDVFVSLPHPQRFEPRLVVDQEPYLVPLLLATSHSPLYLVVLTDTHRGQIHSASADDTDLIEELNEAVPPRQRASGERWGKQQATIEHHRDERILHYHKDLVDRMQAAWATRRFAGVVLLGEREVLASVRRLLPKALDERVVHTAPHSWKGKPEITEEVRKAIASTMRAEESRLLGELTERKQQDFAVATGTQGVIEALRNGQVADLLLGPDHGERGSQCPNCRALFAEVQEKCPYCRSSCIEGNLWQQILGIAQKHNVPTHWIRGRTDLESWGNVAALLARDQPQWVAAGAR